MGLFMTIPPIRVQFKTACHMLDVSRESLRNIIQTDASFPRPIKTGESKQSSVFFCYAELMEWHSKQKESLNQKKAEK